MQRLSCALQVLSARQIECVGRVTSYRWEAARGASVTQVMYGGLKPLGGAAVLNPIMRLLVRSDARPLTLRTTFSKFYAVLFSPSRRRLQETRNDRC